MKPTLIKIVPVFTLSMVVVLVLFYPLLDTDFGWHLQTGNYILSHLQIPKVDIYTFSVAHFGYIYHSWLTETILAMVYKLLRLNGITLFYSGLLALSTWFLTDHPELKKYFWLRLATVLVWPLAIYVVGLRTQVVSFLGISLIVWLFSHQDLFAHSQSLLKTKRLTTLVFKKWLITTKLWLLIPVFLIWANSHPGFPLGLVLIAFFAGTELLHLKNKLARNNWLKAWLIVLIGLSLLTVINPYGLSLHQFIFQMNANPTPYLHNTDWQPYLENPLFDTTHHVLMIGWFLAAILITKKHLSLKIAAIIFFVGMLQSTRFAMPLVAILISLTPLTLLELLKSQAPSLLKRQRLFVAIVCVAIGTLLYIRLSTLTQTMVINRSDETYAQASQSTAINYPYQAVLMLRQAPRSINILNYYTWGGYLIWQLPEHKVFIDGRMDNVFVNGHSFLDEYNQLVNLGDDWEKIISQYSIDAVLLPPTNKLATTLEQRGWKILQQDESSVLLLNPNFQ